MVGAAFCHICGMGRHRSADPSAQWTKYLNFLKAVGVERITRWFGLPLPAVVAFLAGTTFLLVALAQGLRSGQEFSDFEAIQLWRIQWLMAACASFLAGILLKNSKSAS